MTLSTVRTGARREHAPIGLAAALLAVGATGAVTAAAGQSAVAAHTISVKDEAALHATHKSGSRLTEEGSATGTLRGTATANISTSGPHVEVTAVLHVSGGTITVFGSGTLNTGGGTEVSFKAPGHVTGGTGKYSHVSGKGTVYGSLNRVNDSARIQVEGHLSY
jgi:hypothetical protein